MDYKYILLIPLSYFTITVVSMINEYINISTLETTVDSDRQKEEEEEEEEEEDHVDDNESVDSINISPRDDTTVRDSTEDTKKED
jgi:hypothetical protein